MNARPEELRAINAANEALAKGAVRRHQDLIISVAIEHEIKSDRSSMNARLSTLLKTSGEF